MVPRTNDRESNDVGSEAKVDGIRCKLYVIGL